MRGVNSEKGYHACKDTTFSYIPKIFLSLKESCTPFLVAADELACSQVLAHDAHGLHFRGRVYGACDEMYQRSVYLYVAPALSPEESVYLNLPDCLQTYPFGAYITGIGVLQIHAFTNQSSVI